MWFRYIVWDILVLAGDTRSRLQIHCSRIRRQFAQNQPHERRFAGAIAADEADPLPSFDLQVSEAFFPPDVRRITETEAHVTRLDDRQGCQAKGKLPRSL